MPRYLLLLEYDGSPFCGWQRQARGVSLQQLVEEAAFALCGERVTVAGAGRTDAGVHALGQAAHVDLPKNYREETVRDALNAYLGSKPICVLAARRLPPDFHARFSSLEKSYIYYILNRRAPGALAHKRVWRVGRSLNVAAMAEAAAVLRGYHDFTSFRAAGCQGGSPLRTLDALDVARRGALVVVTARSRAFLYRQVRIMVGCLKRVGEGSWSAEDVRRVLQAKDRSVAAATAPACGLYLASVRYPPPFDGFLPSASVFDATFPLVAQTPLSKKCRSTVS